MSENRGYSQARSDLDYIVALMKRLDHITRECAGEDCSLSDDEIAEGLGYGKGPVTDEDRAAYHDEEAALDAIHDAALSVEVRTGWHIPGEKDVSPDEYCILLSTGGPATRIIGRLNLYRVPETALLQYNDWYEPWRDFPANDEEQSALLDFASSFYFGD